MITITHIHDRRDGEFPVNIVESIYGVIVKKANYIDDTDMLKEKYTISFIDDCSIPSVDIAFALGQLSGAAMVVKRIK